MNKVKRDKTRTLARLYGMSDKRLGVVAIQASNAERCDGLTEAVAPHGEEYPPSRKVNNEYRCNEIKSSD